MKNPSTISSGDELHAAIMNIPCHPYRDGEEFVIGYKFGHRDARHAAAELVASLATQPAPAEPAPCKRCGGTRVVDDGEIDCYPDGSPYLNGPVKCVKDCPVCTPNGRPVGAESKACASVGVEPTVTDAQLGAAAYKGYDEYWTEDCHGLQDEAWIASAKAVMALASPAPSVGELVADPLQGAADWLKSGLVDVTVADIQSRLLIGYNRARRLFDGATPPAAPATGEAPSDCGEYGHSEGACGNASCLATHPSLNAEDFLDGGLADVQDEGGVLTYYSRSAVLECIQAALDATPAPAVGASSEPSEQLYRKTEFLCQIWGEDIDHTLTAIVPDWDGVRRFCVEFWTGREDAADYDGSLTLDNLKNEFDEHEADGRGAYAQTWEIGGVSVERICNCSPAAIPAPASVQPVLASLSDEQMTEIARVAHAEGRMSWAGFKEDADGKFTIPVLSAGHMALVRAVLATTSSAAVPAGDPDGKRYRLLRRGQHWSVIDGIGNTLRAEELDDAIDQAEADASQPPGAATPKEAS